MERSKVHIIDPKGNPGAVMVGLGDARNSSLHVDTFLPKPMICWEFYFYCHNLAERRNGKGGIFSAPGDKNPTPANVFRIHRGSHPERRRSDVTAELNINTGAFSPVNISHCRSPTLANLALQIQLDQYSQWAIPLCCPRLAARKPALADANRIVLEGLGTAEKLMAGWGSGKYLGRVNTR